MQISAVLCFAGWAVVTVLAALWGITVAARLPSALRHAYERQTTIDRLRRDGRRYAGRLQLGRVVYWLRNDPELEVTIAYDSPGGSRQVKARMRSSPERVPTDGSPVVLSDQRGAVHLELDLEVTHSFEPEQRYTAGE